MYQSIRRMDLYFNEAVRELERSRSQAKSTSGFRQIFILPSYMDVRFSDYLPS